MAGNANRGDWNHHEGKQIVNNCAIMFDSDVKREDQDRVKCTLNVNNVVVEEKYLGLPTPEGRMCKEHFKSMKDRLAKRLFKLG
jgi:hypothetical protein